MAIFPDVRHTQMWSQDNQIQQPFVVSTIPAPSEDQLVAKSRGWKLYKSEQEDSVILDLFHVNSFCSHKAMRIYDTLLCPNCGKHAPKKIVVTGVMINPNFVQNTPHLNDFNRTLNNITTTRTNKTANANITSWVVKYASHTY